MSDSSNVVKKLYRHQTLLDILLEFEHVLDDANLYAWDNWFDGVVEEGPTPEKYWVSVTLKFPYDKMPDPSGGLNLLNLGCRVSYRRAIEDHVVTPRQQSDIVNAQTQQPRTVQRRIWLVTIEMPRRFIDDRFDSIVDDDEDQYIDVNDAVEGEMAQEDQFGGAEEMRGL